MQLLTLLKIFEWLLNRYKIGLEALKRGGHFIFDCVHLLYYRCRKTATINPINEKYHKYFQYAVTVTLSHEKIGEHPE